MKDKLLLLSFVSACLFASGWAFYLIGVHYDAVAGIEGGACGPEGGCQAVLQSGDAEIFGVPVSVPAVPLFAALALLGLLLLQGKLDRERVSSLATACGLVGLLFGGWLLFKMIFYIDSICRFCLIMDASNAAVLVLGMLLHPRGPVAALRSVAGVVKRAAGPGPELAVLGAVLAGSLAVHASTVRSEEAPTEVAQVEEPATPAVSPEPATPRPAPAATRPAPSSSGAVPASGRPAEGTRRLVLSEERASLSLDASVPFRGPADAPVEIVLFEDFQCPYCKKLSGNVEVLLEDPEIASKVRVGYMHYPMHQSCNANELSRSLHKFACSAAAASICAQEQGSFWEMHDMLFRNNGRLRSGNLRGYAKKLGLDVPRWETCMRSSGTRDKILADTRIGGAAGVKGTPSFFVNGRRLVGAQPVESIRAAVEVELEGREGRVLLDVPLEGETIGDLEGAAPTVTFEGTDGPFTIDAFEASMEGSKALSRPGVEPARSRTWYEADAACKAAGKRLCTEREWLQACSGAVPIDEDGDGLYSRDLLQGRQHAYGEHYRSGWCADSRKGDDQRPLLTGNHPRCSTPEGVYDLDGVVKEWVGLSPDKAALKGGSYKSGAQARCGYYKDSEAPEVRDDTIGFRCCSGGDPDAQASSDSYPGGKVGDRLRSFEGPLADGSGTWRSSSVQGKPLILTFWATWCEPCKKELPALADAYNSNRSQGLEVLGINVDRDPSKTRAFLRDNPLPFPVILDTDKAIMDTFQSRSGGVPLTFWVRSDGTIRQRSTGYDDSAHARFLESVRSLLDK